MSTLTAPEPEIEEEIAPKSGFKVATAASKSAKDKAAQREIESLKSQLKQATRQAPAPGTKSATLVPAQSKLVQVQMLFI